MFPRPAKRAIQNFFTPRNLTALRELALRRTAERVDDQMVDYLRQNAIEGPWATVGTPARLRRARCAVGSRRSRGRAPGDRPQRVMDRALCRARRTGGAKPRRAVKRLDEALRLAERLGRRDRAASRVTISPAKCCALRGRENITQIVVGRSRAGFLARLCRRSLTEEIVRRSAEHRRPGHDRRKRRNGRRRASSIRAPDECRALGGVGRRVVSVAITVGVG